jgi:hypothetical protein
VIDMRAPTMALYERELRTDARFLGKEVTKPFGKSGGFKGTALNPNYVNARLTHGFTSSPCASGS